VAGVLASVLIFGPVVVLAANFWKMIMSLLTYESDWFCCAYYQKIFITFFLIAVALLHYKAG
jgi:hypothetical protein